MNTHSDKIAKNKSQVVANRSLEQQSNGESTFHLLNKRPEVNLQKKLQAMADNSLQAKQIKAYQTIADHFIVQTAKQKERQENEILQGKTESIQPKAGLEVVNLSQGKFSIKRANLLPAPQGIIQRLKFGKLVSSDEEGQLELLEKEAIIAYNRMHDLVDHEQYGDSIGTLNKRLAAIREKTILPGDYQETKQDLKKIIADANLLLTKPFKDNLNSRSALNAKMEALINEGSTFDESSGTLKVKIQKLKEAAAELNKREREQREYVKAALWADTNLFAGMEGHEEKDRLWRSMLPSIDTGRKKSVGEEMSPQVKLKTKTSLAQIIGDAVGETLMSFVTREAGRLGVSITYVESKAEEDFNLQVSALREDDRDPAKLTGLRVILPDAGKYNEGQSFKRVSPLKIGGASDVSKEGSALSVSPIDTDFFHEFVHAAHYLVMEKRRRDKDEGYEYDIEGYDTKTESDEKTVRLQDDVSEARTIHRSRSYRDLTNLAMHGLKNVDHTVAGDYLADMSKVPKAMAHSHHALDGIPSENDYRQRIGLSARQDHKALIPSGRGYSSGHSSVIETE